METIKLKRRIYQRLGQALKAAGLCESGVDAKYAIEGRPGKGKRKRRVSARQKAPRRR